MAEFEPLYTSDEMRAAEQGHDVATLMERAGSGAAEAALQAFGDAERWTVVAGGGANGGDGRIAARRLAEAGKDVRIVDALFGTGFSGEPRAAAAELIDRINAAGVPVFAIDLPSGVDASSGEIAGVAVKATETVTFHGRKLGVVVAPGRFYAGTVRVLDIGLEP